MTVAPGTAFNAAALSLAAVALSTDFSSLRTGAAPPGSPAPLPAAGAPVGAPLGAPDGAEAAVVELVVLVVVPELSADAPNAVAPIAPAMSPALTRAIFTPRLRPA